MNFVRNQLKLDEKRVKSQKSKLYKYDHVVLLSNFGKRWKTMFTLKMSVTLLIEEGAGREVKN